MAQLIIPTVLNTLIPGDGGWVLSAALTSLIFDHDQSLTDGPHLSIPSEDIDVDS